MSASKTSETVKAGDAEPGTISISPPTDRGVLARPLQQ